jgi:diguanylate cyclase (GGDEF)-like protein
VNDSWGHAAGDELLVGMSERVLGCLRPEDVAARLGGDEFAVLLEGLTSPEQAGEVAQRIIEAFREPFTVGDSQVRVQTSIGIVATEPGRRRPEELLRDADVAMYAAKSRGKGRFEYFDHDMRVGAIERLELKDSLQRAIDEGEFLLRYQPIVELATNQIIGAEALLRWRDRDRGMIPPAKFIGLAEEAGMMDTIGRWVLREACRTAQRFQDPDGRPFRISVNLSPRQIDQPGLAEEVAETLSDTHVDPNNLVIEITEQIFMQDSPHVAVNLRKLKETGVRLAIDDFGTGYSSLSYLQRFPVDYLKIDKSFIDLLGDGTDKPVLAGAIIQIAHSLGLKVVAEGIELPEQLAHLRSLNCDYGQGFLFAKPLESQNMAKYWRLAEVQTIAPNGADEMELGAAETVAQPTSG